jgi:hypothetical protein
MKAITFLVSCAALLAQAAVHAQSWPSKPIRWIVPFPPGGPADVVTRIVSSKLAERTGQPNVVENRGGAGGNVGHEAAAKAPADGYTVLFVVPAVVTNPYYLKASIDPFKELAPVIHLDSAWMVLLTTPAFPASTVAEVIAQARAKPGAVSCAASGALPQVGCEMLRAYAGADMIMVQYKGNAPALNAVMGGEVNLIFDLVNTSQGQVKVARRDGARRDAEGHRAEAQPRHPVGAGAARRREAIRRRRPRDHRRRSGGIRGAPEARLREVRKDTRRRRRQAGIAQAAWTAAALSRSSLEKSSAGCGLRKK